MIVKNFNEVMALAKRQLSPPLQYLSVFVIIILGFMLANHARSLLFDKQVGLEDFERQRQDFLTLVDKEVWSLRLEKAKELQTQAKGKLWKGPSPGVIGAKLGQSLRVNILPFTEMQSNRAARRSPTTITVSPDLEQGDQKQEILRFNGSARINRGEVDEVIFEMSKLSPSIYFTQFRITFPPRQNQSASIFYEGYVDVSIEAASQ